MAVQYSSVLVRYGEIAIKSDRTRRRMTSLLTRSIRGALREHSVTFKKVRVEYGRIFVDSDQAERAAEVTSQVFGVVSTSPVVVTDANLDIIVEQGLALARANFKEGLTFAVGARRVGTHDFTSQEVREILGARILKELADLNLRVNLSNPEQLIYVEVRNNLAYIFTDTVKGAGGMPTGSQGKVVCTVSTGLDSPIAAYKVMKRGCIPVFVHFDMFPYSSSQCKDLAIRQVRHLAGYVYGYEVKLYIIPHGEGMMCVQESCPAKLICIFCRRNMLRMARLVAIKENADAIVTGEIIGEQASQTSRNLRVTDAAVCDYPILRPCAGDDKVEIEHFAAKIGTYKFAEEGLSGCCGLVPDYPSIHADLETVENAEKNIDLSILNEQVENAEVIILRSGKSLS